MRGEGGKGELLPENEARRRANVEPGLLPNDSGVAEGTGEDFAYEEPCASLFGAHKGLGLWRWRESNPRPRATGWGFYGRSRRSGLTSRLPAAEDLLASLAAMSGGGRQAEPPP